MQMIMKLCFDDGNDNKCEVIMDNNDNNIYFETDDSTGYFQFSITDMNNIIELHKEWKIRAFNDGKITK